MPRGQRRFAAAFVLAGEFTARSSPRVNAARRGLHSPVSRLSLSLSSPSHSILAPSILSLVPLFLLPFSVFSTHACIHTLIN